MIFINLSVTALIKKFRCFYYTLLPDTKRQKLRDSKIRFEVKGTASVIARTSVKTPTHTKFHNILTEYLSYRADTDNRTIVHKIRDNALHTKNNVMT